MIDHSKKIKVLRVALIALLLSGAAFGAWYFFTSHAGGPDNGTRAVTTKLTVPANDYTCPMHQQIHSDKPGDCPICGMRLVKRSTLKNTSGSSDSSMEGKDRGVMLTSQSAIRANVSTIVVEKKLLTDQLRLPGTIEIAEPNERMVTARVRGRVDKLYVKETGASIQAGMPLYELYSPDLSNDVAQYLLVKNAREPENMVHEHSGSPFDLEAAAHTKLKLYELTDRQIEDIGKSGVTPRTFTIYARTNGTVLKKGILEGAWIDEGTMLFQVADLSTVWALLDIPEDALASVRIGQKVIVTSPAYPHDKFSGTVIFISPVLNATTRTARIRIALANPTQRLKIQMAVEGSIAIASQKTLAIPASAVVHNGDENIVWVKHSGGMFYPQRVELGYKDADGYYAVLSGLDEGDEIAVSGTFLIDSERQLEMGSTSMPGMDMKSNPERQQTSSKNTSTTTK